MMNRNKYYMKNWHIGLDKFLDKFILNDISKFNSKTVFNLTSDNKKDKLPGEVYEWLLATEKKISLPEEYEQEIYLENQIDSGIPSTRNFNTDSVLSFSDISIIMHAAFGASQENLSRKYPSGGGLYPVSSILVVFDSTKIQGLDKEGAYYYDCFENKLLLVKSWNASELKAVQKAICPLEQDFLANSAIVYVGDLRRSILKYNYLGYKHILIETGMMAQSFRESLKIDSEVSYGDLSYSAYNDFSLIKSLGYNPRLAIATMVQWFGVKKG